MLAEPQTLTINAVARNLARINNGDSNAGTFRLRSPTEELLLNIRHGLGVKVAGGAVGETHLVKVTDRILAVGTTPAQEFNAWVAIHIPQTFDLARAKNNVVGLRDYLTSALLDKVLNGEA